MARKCASCNIAERYKYWNEFTPTKHRFVAKMSDNYEHKLRIPKKFVECFKGPLSRCTLIGPSGNKWTVRVSNAGEGHDGVVFLNGWKNFVEDHGVRVHDTLTFHYVGESSFEVVIYDANDCEREGSHFAKNGSTSLNTCTSTLHVEEIYDSSEDVNGSHCSIKDNTMKREGKKKRRTQSFEEHDSLSEDFKGEKTKEVSGNDTEDESWFSTDKDEAGDCNFKPITRQSSFGRGKSTRAKISQMYYISNRRMLKEREKLRAAFDAKAHKPKSGAPMVQITMRPTYVYSGFNMTIPKKWAVEHMLKEPHQVELRVPLVGKSWSVGCRWTASVQCQLRANWPSFVFDNNLEEHDVCVFELVKMGKSGDENPIIDVYIYRVVDNPVTLTVARRMV